MTLSLVEKINLVDNVWAFRFQFSEPFSWVAGQFVHVKLPLENPDAEGEERWFTNSAAPYEGILQITTRITESTFKRTLSLLELGSTNLQFLDGPEGDFVWEDSGRPNIFIAGGIGVTPFYSMLKQRVHDRKPLQTTLVYNSRTAELPFKDELSQWTSDDHSLSVHYITGIRLSVENLVQVVPELNTSLVYLSGPEPMVESLGNGLKVNGLAESQLKQDFFPSYNETNY